VNTLQRNFILSGTGEVTNDEFPQLTVFNYELDISQLSNSTSNIATYNNLIYGTSNLTTLAMTDSFASFGHFYGISQDANVQKSIPVVRNATTGATIYAS